MINHAYALLRNRRGIGVDTELKGAYTPPAYAPVALPAGLERVRRVLFGGDPDSVYLGYRLWQYANLLHAGDYADYLYALDPRVSYWPPRADPDFGFGVRVATIAGSEPLYVHGTAAADDATGRSDLYWKIEVLSTPLAPLMGAAAPPDVPPEPGFRPLLGGWFTPSSARSSAAVLSVANRVVGRAVGAGVLNNPAALRSVFSALNRVAHRTSSPPPEAVNPARRGNVLGVRSRIQANIVRSGVPALAAPAGGVQFGGAVARPIAYRPAPAGGVKLGGVAPMFAVWKLAPSGGATLGGVRAPTYSFRPPPSGGVKPGGAAQVASAWTLHPAGGVRLGGVAGAAAIWPIQASGGVAVGGVARPALAGRPQAVGGVAVGGGAAPLYVARPARGGGLKIGGAIDGGGAGRTPSSSGGVRLGGGLSPRAALPAVATGGFGLGGSASVSSSTSVPRMVLGKLVTPFSRITRIAARTTDATPPPAIPNPVHVRITPFHGLNPAFPPAEVTAAFADGLSEPIALPGSKLRVQLTPYVESGDAYEVFCRVRPGRDLTAVVAELRADPRATPVELFGALPVAPYDTFARLWFDHDQLPEQLTGLLLALIYRTEAYRLS